MNLGAKITSLGMIFMLIVTLAAAQRERAYNWTMPTNCGINFSGNTPANFTSTMPGAVLSQGSSTISDENGNLQFYSNGEKAWNYLHQEMSGGGNLLGHSESTQSSLIIPAPLSNTRYYLFTMDDNGVGDGLNYYLVDMSLNGGEGLVLPPTQLATNVTEKLCATKHANDFDYWVLTHKWHSDTFLAFHVDSFGVDPVPIVSTVGEVHTGNTNSAMGQMKISPDGTKIGIASLSGGHIELLSFNNATGEVSAPLLIESFVSHFPFGIAFSPDSRKLYYTQRFSAIPEAILYQYDLDHLDTNCLLDSEFNIAQINALKVPSNLQLATDGKIYMTVNYFPTYDTLAVINNPNEYGNAANFDEFGYVTNNVVREGLPGFVSTFVSDGIHVEFGTTCDGMLTTMWPADSLTPDSVRWNFGDPTSSNNSSVVIETSHLYSHPDTFLITLFAFEGTETDTFYRNVVIWDTTVNLLGNDTTICNGTGSVTLDASWYNACHSWSTGATSSSISVTTAGTYWVDVHYQSCSFRDSITVLDVTGPPVFSLGADTSVCGSFSFELDPHLPNAYYTWNDGSHDTTFTVTSTGTYSLTATNACGDSSDDINVTVNTSAQPTINFPNDTTICDSAELTYDLTFENANYLWHDGNINPVRTLDKTGEYWIKISNICDTVSDTINVVVESELESVLQPIDLLCAEDELLQLVATADTQTVLWSSGISTPILAVNKAGFYAYETQNTCGTLADSIEIVVWDTNYQLFIGLDTLICDLTTEIEIGDTGQNFLFDYQWDNDSTGSKLRVAGGTYVLKATNRCASISDTVSIEQAIPVEIISPTDSNLCEGESVRLELSSDGITSASWSNGNKSATAVITAPGEQTVRVVDTNLCVFSDRIFIGDNCPVVVFAPNVFTPDGDGVNDAFCVEIENVVEYNISLYNRWGTLVLEVSNSSFCWDGEINGREASAGVYFYLVEAKGSVGDKSTHRGSFTLFR